MNYYQHLFKVLTNINILKGIVAMNETRNLEITDHKKSYIKVVIFLVLLIGILIICYAYISNARNEKIKGGVYFGINLGMKSDEVEERLKIRAKGSDKVNFTDDHNIYILQNYHLLNDHNFYVDESYMFEENILTDIFINIKCLDTSVVDKMQEDSIEKFVELYGNFEIIDNFRTWKKDGANIRMIDNHPTRQHITVLISDLNRK
jgi:hypothetical protein